MSAAAQWAERPVMVFEGQHDTHIKTGEDYQTLPLGSFWTMPPSAARKDRSLAFVPSTYCGFDGRKHEAQREHGSFAALVGDVDKGDHSKQQILDALTKCVGACAHLIYTSAHAREGNMRWRMILPLAEPVPFAEWCDAQLAFFDGMGSLGIPMDYALARAGQPVYLPNVPDAHASSGTPLRGEDGQPLFYTATKTDLAVEGLRLDRGPISDAIAALRERREADERQREELREQARRRAATRSSDETSPIDAFNRGNSLPDLLLGYGYEQSPRNRDDWRSRHQTSGSYATRVIGDKWVSLSGSDAAAGVGETFKDGCFGDAYDLFVFYEHGGDKRAAWGAACREYGIDRNRPAQPFKVVAGTEADPSPAEREERAEGRPEPDEPQRRRSAAPERPRGLPLIDMSKWIGDPPPRRSLWGDMLPLLQTTMLTGPGGVGKSLFEQALATHIALGIPFLGQQVEQRNALYVTCEDDPDELWRRQAAICAAIGVPLSAIEGKLVLVSLTGETGTELATFDVSGRILPTDRWLQLEETCEDYNIGLYAFDNATDAMGGDLNDIHQVATFVNMLTGLAIKRDGVAMIIHHPNKAGDDWLGSVAWHNKVRSRMMIELPNEDDPDGRLIRNPKANYGPSGGSIAFRWHRGTFVCDDDLPADYAAELAQSIKVNGENSAFLACLRERTEQGEGRLVGPSPGPNYAPTQFEKMTQAKGLKKAVLARAMERLFTIGAIESYTYRNTAKGRDVTIIREVGSPTPNPTPNASRTLDPNDPEQSTRTTPHTHPIPKGISGAAIAAAAPELASQEAMQ